MPWALKAQGILLLPPPHCTGLPTKTGTSSTGTSTLSFRWYVAQTHPNSERAAQTRLEDQSFTTYLPWLTLRQGVRRGKCMVRQEPLFRGYLLINLDTDPASEPDELWKAVNSTRAVRTLLPSGESPHPIAPGQIERLQTDEAAGNFVWPRSIEPGQRLTPKTGALAEQVLECLDSSHARVRALWDCLGRRTVVTLGLDDVRLLA
jgi:transcriptional antiterminator RfaH